MGGKPALGIHRFGGGLFSWGIVLKLAYYDPKKITDKQIAAYAAPLAAPGGKHALLETGRQIIPTNIDQLLGRYKDINVPTLIIWGKQDKIISPDAGKLLVQAIRNSLLRWVDRCGHVPQEERPETTVPLVLESLPTLFRGFKNTTFPT